MELKLDIKTLLLCNLSLPTNKSYSELFNLSQQKNGAAYFTLGGVDAISVYPTPLQTPISDSEKTNPEEAWLESVLEDKNEVIKKISDTTTYHPVHLVRYTDDRKTSHKNDTRFLFVTFVYGINEAFKKQLQDSSWNSWSIIKKTTTADKGKTVDYYSFSNTGNSAGDYDIEIYDCINISDRVILTYTNDIFGVLDAVCHLETDGFARKTYTMINFRLSHQGIIDDTVHKNIRKLTHDNLSASIRGSIKHNGAWSECYTNGIRSTLNNTPVYFINYGESDFSISVPNIKGADVSELLNYYQDYNEELSKACWDIHTELQLQKEPYGAGGADAPKPALQAMYSDLSANLKQLTREKTRNGLARWTWAYSLKELLSAQVNIERNPVLNGPSYLLFDSFRILFDYFLTYNCYKSNFSNPDTGNFAIVDIASKDFDQLFSESRDGIERSIRCLSQLTDQLTRNDDIIFRGIGRIPAIATTLPENLLEFYHAFLREIAEFLVKVDGKKGHIDTLTPVNYRYGFLISPETNQRARISQVFNTEHRYRKTKDGTFRSWPSEQIHIIQFPINDIFHPSQCMIPLAHECFHFFGDYLRFRKVRAAAISSFLATLYVDTFAFDFKVDKETRQDLARVLARFFRRKTSDEADLYLSDLEDFLIQRFKRFLSDAGTYDLYQSAVEDGIAPPDYLFYIDNIRKRARVETSFNRDVETDFRIELTPRSILFYCSYYFKECYADFMSIITLGLSPREYRILFDTELPNCDEYGPVPNVNTSQDGYSQKRINTWFRLVQVCQRISIVYAALYRAFEAALNDPKTSEDEQKELINKLHELIKEAGAEKGIENTDNELSISAGKEVSEKELIKITFCALVNPNTHPLPPTIPGVFPVAPLRSVVDYLYYCYQEIQNDTDKIVDDDGYQIKDLQNKLATLFDNLIRKEGIFAPHRDNKSEDIISENRKRIEEEAKQFIPKQ